MVANDEPRYVYHVFNVNSDLHIGTFDDLELAKAAVQYYVNHLCWQLEWQDPEPYAFDHDGRLELSPYPIKILRIELNRNYYDND